MQLPWALLQVHGQHICVAVGNAVALGFVAGAWATHLCWCIGHEVPGWPGYIAQAAGGANIEECTHLRARGRVLVKGGAHMHTQVHNADVPTKLNLPFLGVN